MHNKKIRVTINFLSSRAFGKPKTLNDGELQILLDDDEGQLFLSSVKIYLNHAVLEKRP